MSGWAAKRRLRSVDLPAPDGPDITIGRCFCVAGTEGWVSGGEGERGREERRRGTGGRHCERSASVRERERAWWRWYGNKEARRRL